MEAFPVTRIAEPRTVRLVSSARLRDPVLRKLADDMAGLEALAEIEGATSGRLTAQARGAENIDPREFVAGIPHAYFINAAFAYWRPRERNRFNGPGRGAWYAALKTETCIAEVAFHVVRELQRVNDFNTRIHYTEMFASFAGDFMDLRARPDHPECLHPDPAVGYPVGNVLAEHARAQGHNGIIYPSVRDKGGTCLVALHPQAVQSVAQGRVLQLVWQGDATPSVEVLSA